MRTALWVAGAVMLGIAAADWLRPHPLLALVLLGLCLLWTVAAVQARGRVVWALLATVLALGALRYSFVQTAGRGSLAAWEGQRIDLEGTVATEPQFRLSDAANYVVTAEAVGDGQPVTGRVYVTQWGGEMPGFGERVRLTGRLKPPDGPKRPGGYDEAGYLARQAVYLAIDVSTVDRLGPGRLSLLQRGAVTTRLRLERVLKETLPPEQAALMAGLLFGSRSELPEQIKEAFKASGVLHLLAVSGGNVAMIVMPFLALLAWVGVPRRWAATLAILLVVFFVFLTGAGPSVLRAGLMAVLVLTGDILERERDAVNTLGSACLLLLLWQPGLLFDLGLQLSAAATLGILLFTRPIQTWLTPRLQPFFGEKPGQWLAAGLAVTLAAQVVVEPISLHAFGTFSTVAPIANLLVLAFLEPVVQVGSVAALTGLLWLLPAWLLGWLVRIGLFGLVFVVKATAAAPGAYLKVGSLPPVGMLAWYAVLVLVVSPAVRRWFVSSAWQLIGRWRSAGHLQRALAAVTTTLLVLTGVVWRMALADSPDTLRVTFLDVGQGDAVLIQEPGGHTMLVDAGPALPPDSEKGWEGFDMGAEVVAPYLQGLGIRRLDYMVLTHLDQDHAGGGQAVLEAFSVGSLLLGGVESPESNALQAWAAQSGISVQRPSAGQQIQLGQEVWLNVLNPPAETTPLAESNENTNCLALLLQYRRVRLLLACDLEAQAEARLVAQADNLTADVLKVAHHGASQSSTESFLDAVRPAWAVISVGSGNAYGHPSPKTLARLRSAGVGVLRTDRHGNVLMKTDGVTVSLFGSRAGPLEDGASPLAVMGRRWLFSW